MLLPDAGDWIASLINRNKRRNEWVREGAVGQISKECRDWIDEFRNMLMPVPQQGLWFLGGNIRRARFHSHLQALQLQARLPGVSLEIG